VRIAVAKTKDFNQVERPGGGGTDFDAMVPAWLYIAMVALMTEADYRNVVIFPERLGGLYARLDRPHSEIAPWSIWITYSPGLRFWGESQLIMKPVPYHWDKGKSGLARRRSNRPGMALHLSRTFPDNGRIDVTLGSCSA
jgi:hypothetical protein